MANLFVKKRNNSSSQLQHKFCSSFPKKRVDIYNFHVYNNYMIFEWDLNKNKSNILKHGLDFELARYILERERYDN